MDTRSLPGSFRLNRRGVLTGACSAVVGLVLVDRIARAADATPAASPEASPVASPAASVVAPKAVFAASIASFRFVPPKIEIPAGTTVTWTNKDVVSHTVTQKVSSGKQLFASDLINPGQSYSFTFETPGTYNYYCVPHPFMTGIVVVS